MFKNGISQGNPNSSQICIKGMELLSIMTLIRATLLLLQNDPEQQTELTEQLPTSSWNAQGAITKTSAIKTAIVQDDLDILMIQDTRYKRRLDDFPNLRIHGYHTFHRTMDEGGHGMVAMIRHPIPLEEAEQIHLGDGTETLSTRIWLKNKPLLLHNIYRVDGERDKTTPLSREPRSIMVGDFNARDEMWCRDHNRAGHILNEQLQNPDNFCLSTIRKSGPQSIRRQSTFHSFRLPWFR